jgi:hypothetical protein
MDMDMDTHEHTSLSDDSYVLPPEYVEVEILPQLTPQDVLATAGSAWGDFCFFLLDMIVWMTLEVYVCASQDYYRFTAANAPMVLSLGADFTRNFRLCVHVTRDTPAAAATETCDGAIRLMATCGLPSIFIGGPGMAEPPPFSGAALSLSFQESRSCLRKVSLNCMTLSYDLCRALATISRLDVELNISNCSLSDDAAGAFVECLHSDRDPVELIGCKIDSQIFASALAVGNSRVIRLRQYNMRTTDAQMAVYPRP